MSPAVDTSAARSPIVPTTPQSAFRSGRNVLIRYAPGSGAAFGHASLYGPSPDELARRLCADLGRRPAQLVALEGAVDGYHVTVGDAAGIQALALIGCDPPAPKLRAALADALDGLADAAWAPPSAYAPIPELRAPLAHLQAPNGRALGRKSA